jgi:DNA-binding response OmpR family regulator
MDDYTGAPRAGDVLIADDDVALRGLLVRFLRDEGFAVREAFNATEALMQIAARPPALLLLDIMMPEISGLQVFDQLRTAGQSFPIVVITGLPGNAQSLIEQYHIICIEKPLDLAELLRCVAKYVQRAPAK